MRRRHRSGARELPVKIGSDEIYCDSATRVAILRDQSNDPMKFFTSILLLISCLCLCAASPADEKAFTEKYKTAFEAKDTHTLESFLYTAGSDSTALEFYKMMMTGEAGNKISQIELVALTPEEAKKAKEPQDGPTGKLCLTLSPTKKLVIKVEQKDANGSSTSTSSSFVAEKDGKLVIPVPGPCK